MQTACVSTRRRVIGQLTVGGAAATVAAVPATAEAASDPHPHWRVQERALNAEMLAAYAAGDCAGGDRLNGLRWDLRSKILDTPARTAAGLALRVRLVAEHHDEGLALDADEFDVLLQVADALEQLGRAQA